LCGDTSLLTGPRKYGQLVASQWPLRSLPPSDFAVPWAERVLSVVIDSPCGSVELHTTGIPPGSSNGWIKIEQLEGIYRRLARPCGSHGILCGDFNAPQAEGPDGTVVTWAQKMFPDGRVVLVPRRADRWDRGERNVLTGLAGYDLGDVYRRLHGCSVREYSWYWRGKGRSVGRRFDHVFASHSLNPSACHYLHSMREFGLSDHSPVDVVFSPTRRSEGHSC
jgi:exonuclease III